jgi:hypothetical protein
MNFFIYITVDVLVLGGGETPPKERSNHVILLKFNMNIMTLEVGRPSLCFLISYRQSNNSMLNATPG